MMRLGRNLGGYFGETIRIDDVVSETTDIALRQQWAVEKMTASPGIDLVALTRSPLRPASWAPRIYLSAGIHGDEPAGPLAVRRLMATGAFSEAAWFWCCPCLNPTGFPGSTRTSASGIDLNRDYLRRASEEVRAHVAWLEGRPMFDLALCLHEDWEAAGFYVYELNPAATSSLAPAMIEAVRPVCPIDLSPLIDGREASEGLIRPALDPVTRTEWPEAFYLIQNKTRLSYTLEAPSDFPLEMRVAALESAVRAALDTFLQSHAATPPEDRCPPPP